MLLLNMYTNKHTLLWPNNSHQKNVHLPFCWFILELYAVEWNSHENKEFKAAIRFTV